jgi:hypothetical protein
MEKQLLYLLDYQLRVTEKELCESLRTFLPITASSEIDVCIYDRPPASSLSQVNMAIRASSCNTSTAASLLTPPEESKRTSSSDSLASEHCSTVGHNLSFAQSTFSSCTTYSELDSMGLTDDNGSCSSSSSSEVEDPSMFPGASAEPKDTKLVLRPLPAYAYRRKAAIDPYFLPSCDSGGGSRFSRCLSSGDGLRKPDDSLTNFHQKSRTMEPDSAREILCSRTEQAVSSSSSRIKSSSSGGFLTRMWNIGIGKASVLG